MVKFRIFLVLIFFISMSTISFAQQTVELPGGCTVSVPEGMLPESDNTPDAQTFVNDQSVLVLNVSSFDLEGKDIPIEDLEKGITASLNQQFRELQISYNEIEKINNRDVYVIYGKALMNSINVSLTIYLYVIDGYAYSLICACLEDDVEKHADLFDGVAASLVKK